MAKSSRRGKCPPGVFCISGGLGTTLLLIVVIALLFFMYAVFFLKPQAPTIIMPKQERPQTTIIPIKGGDSRYDMAPQPLRDWMALPEYPPRGGIASIPINIPTQGLPESFQSVGVVRVDEKILPLYGRRTAGEEAIDGTITLVQIRTIQFQYLFVLKREIVWMMLGVKKFYQAMKLKWKLWISRVEQAYINMMGLNIFQGYCRNG